MLAIPNREVLSAFHFAMASAAKQSLGRQRDRFATDDSEVTTGAGSLTIVLKTLGFCHAERS